MPMSDLVKGLLVGGVALAATGGLVAYHAAQAAAAPALPPATPAPSPTQWVQGQSYQFYAPLPAGVSDPTALATALGQAGWQPVQVDWPWGDAPAVPAALLTAMQAAGVSAPASGYYVAEGTFTAATTNVPTGVISIAAAATSAGADSSTDTGADTDTGGDGSSDAGSDQGSDGSSDAGSDQGSDGSSDDGASVGPSGGGASASGASMGPSGGSSGTGSSSSSTSTGSSSTSSAPTPITGGGGQFVQGRTYQFAAALPSGVADAATLANALAAAGWTSVTVDWPWGSGVPTELAADMSAAGTGVSDGDYVAQGTYGAATAAIPSGVYAIDVTPASATPAAAPTATWTNLSALDSIISTSGPVMPTGITLPVGARVRLNIADADFRAALASVATTASNKAAALAQQAGEQASQVAQAGGAARTANTFPPTRAGFEQFLSMSPVTNLLGTTYLWAVGDLPPVDWPSAPGTAGATGWKVEFVVLASTGVALSDLMSAMQVAQLFAWQAAGTGQAAVTQTQGFLWSEVATINPGDQVRCTMAIADFNTLEQSLNANFWPTPTCSALLALVGQASFAAILGTPHVLVWCGADFLPPDWPLIDDTSAYHFEFRYEGALPFPVAGGPLPLDSAWTAGAIVSL